MVMILSSMISMALEEEFTTYENCKLIHEDWNDGDSFQMKLPDGTKKVFRLYGVDCLETSDKQEFMKKRLDTQAFYFGIYRKDDASKRHKRLKQLGKKATQEMKRLLGKPFTVITRHKSARGKFGSRFYAYVLTRDGLDVGKSLVKTGHARVYGFIDDLPNVDEGSYRRELYDLEMIALGKRNGIWVKTDWREFLKERAKYRKRTGKININTAKNDDDTLALIVERSGVSKKLVKTVLDKRPAGGYKDEKSLDDVPGVGEKTVKKLAAVLKFK